MKKIMSLLAAMALMLALAGCADGNVDDPMNDTTNDYSVNA